MNELDYRYDSFFATILQLDTDEKLIIPPNFNLVSWNYDFQVEKAFMNFTEETLSETLNRLNVLGTIHKKVETLDGSASFLTKLNGTAAFAKDNSFTTLFDFHQHTLNKESLDVIINILTEKRDSVDTGMRFAWNRNELSKDAVQKAHIKFIEANIIVILGYSFPYFNGEIDRQLFQGVGHGSVPKIYIQCHKDDTASVVNRFKGVCDVHPIQFTELDQFLIPNEL